MFTEEQLSRLTREVIDKAKTEVRTPLLIPATVAVDQTDVSTVTVIVDGDPDGGAVVAENLTGLIFAEDDRVMVQFQPPAGVFVVAGIGGAGKPNGIGWGEIDYAEITADQTGIGVSATDITGLSVTFTLAVARKVEVTAFALFTKQTTTTRSFLIIDQAGQIQSAPVDHDTTGGAGQQSAIAVVRKNLSAGSYTIKARAAAASGTTDVNASATFPSFILIKDIGPG